MAIAPGDVISYAELCLEEGATLQRGMNYRLPSGRTVILMSLRVGAPYADRIEEEGKVLIYEGHDIPKKQGTWLDPKKTDQLAQTPTGRLTQNGHFFKAADEVKRGERSPEPVRVYEKIKAGLWAFNGVFALVDAWQEKDSKRKVYKFKLQLLEGEQSEDRSASNSMSHTRLIPSQVKLEVWKRDAGKCVRCGSNDNLHFDHVIPYSQGGSSLVATNIQLLCARHNLQKRDKIE